LEVIYSTVQLVFGYRKTCIFHAERLKDVFFKISVQLFSGHSLHHPAQNIEGDPVIPALPGLEFQWYLRQAVDNLLKRPIVGFKIGMTRLIELRDQVWVTESVGQSRCVGQKMMKRHGYVLRLGNYIDILTGNIHAYIFKAWN
jgi:hypothetical protein